MYADADYFKNHRLKLKMPWRLYHGQLVEAAAREVRSSGACEVLNVGSGPFLERERLPHQGVRYTLCDVDARAIELAKQLHGGVLRADVVEPSGPLPYRDEAFDLVMAMDVIEHLPDPATWLLELVRVTRRGGHLFFTTPNYGRFSLLPLLECTVLEVIARLQGFSRRGLHPSRFDRRGLVETLRAAGLVEVRVDVISFGWVLAATASRPASA